MNRRMPQNPNRIIMIKDHTDHRTTNYRYRPEHLVLAERALGHALPKGTHVHHFNGVRADNKRNLVICQDAAYHCLLHRRQRERYKPRIGKRLADLMNDTTLSLRIRLTFPLKVVRRLLKSKTWHPKTIYAVSKALKVPVSTFIE